MGDSQRFFSMVLKPKRRRFNLCLSVALLTLTVPWPAYAEGATEEIGQGRRILEQASETANSIGDAKQKASALQEISRAQTLAGDVKGALQTANNIGDGYEKANTLGQIAMAQASAGDLKGAVQTANSISAAYQKGNFLQAISRTQAMTGDVKGALQTANSIEDASQKAGALGQIAMARAMAGDVKGALAWSLDQSSPYLRSYALLGVAEGVLKLKPR